MRKAMGLLIAVLAFAAFVVAPMGAMACGEGKTSADNSTATSKMVSDKSACTAGATKASATSACPAGSQASCAAKLGMTTEDCQKVCAQGQYTLVSMDVKGMTCGSCEEAVSASLSKVPGVVKVGKVDYKSGTAYALIDPMKVKDEQLVKAVSDKGYEAKVIPAVAVEQMSGDAAKMDASGCSAAQKAACAATGKTCGTPKKSDKKDDKKTDGSM
jgi:copper chaperone CopZ